MKTFATIALLFCAFAISSSAQPRPIEKASTSASDIKPAPASFQAKYEGGLIGFTDKAEGTLKFDDANERLVFVGKMEKEMFAIPYESLLVVSPQSDSVTSTTGNVIRHLPLPGAGAAGLMKEKRRYLVLQINDPDADVKGTVNFKLENKELLESVIDALGKKAKLTQRGDAYYRPKAKVS